MHYQTGKLLTNISHNYSAIAIKFPSKIQKNTYKYEGYIEKCVFNINITKPVKYNWLEELILKIISSRVKIRKSTIECLIKSISALC